MDAPELRYDPVSGATVIIAPGRARRPFTVTPDRSGPSGGPSGDPAGSPSGRSGSSGDRSASGGEVPVPGCPFCPGHESDTPPELARVGPGAPGTPGWRVRVFPNLYPIVPGGHEVVALSPHHGSVFEDLDDHAAAEVLDEMRDRTRALLDAGYVHVQPFVNQGRRAGASIEHPHAQIVALPEVPPGVHGALARFEAARTDLVAGQLARAAADGLEVVVGPARAWCPAAPIVPYAVRVAHRSTRARFDEAADAEVAVVAVAVRDALRRVRDALGVVDYNVVVHSAPRGVPPGPFHWYVDVLPRLAVIAGFEHGTGVLVSTVDPRDAAAHLRDPDGPPDPSPAPDGARTEDPGRSAGRMPS